jgi:TolB-like protein/Flp pilus assembly protein TadD
MMPPDDSRGWAEILATFDEVVELDAAARAARLEGIAATDPALQRCLERLLAADAEADALLASVEAAIGSPDFCSTSGEWERDPLGLMGRTVSHFRVLELLAYGGMGVVYRAEDQQLGRAIALKFPLAAHHLDPRVKLRFLHEARVVAGLAHPSLCEIYETGETSDGYLFHAMPLYEGESLRTRLAREGALRPADALAIMTRISQGLSAAHHAGVVHRDLKPANVMLLPDGTVKILDFGLAKVSDLSLTASRTRLGTVFYMAPEQVHGRKLDQRADLWAMGVLLYEMVTGSRPFAGDNEIAVAHAIAHEEPVRPSALRSEIPADLDDMVLRLLRKDPSQRYQSTEDLVSALSAIELGHRPMSFSALKRRPSLRMAALVALAIVAIGAGTWWARRITTSKAAPQAVAILPFDQSDGSGYLAAGLADGITTELSRVRNIIVPGYVTTGRYRGSGKPLKQVAAELEVDALLQGRVQRMGERVSVDARLLDGQGEKHLWTGRYDRPLSELLEIQRDATRGILAALRIRLTGAERDRLDRAMTPNARAYDRYLQARAVELGGLSYQLWIPIAMDSLRRAQSLYSQARDLDPNFAMARARLALMHTYSADLYDASEARREQARLEAEAALRLQPGLPEAHQALANYWHQRGDLMKAVHELKLAITGFPNSSELRLDLGNTYAQAGRLEDAVAEFERAMRLEPGSPKAAFSAAVFYLRLRRDEDAMRAFDHAIALAPDYHMVKVIKGHTYLRWKGLPDTLADAMRTIPTDWDPSGMGTYARYTVLRAQRRYTEALGMLDRSGIQLSRDGLVYQPVSLMRAQLYETLGERARARANYAVARGVLRDSVSARPDDASMRVSLGLAYAGLGQRTQAVREARRAMELVPLASNTPAATAFMGVAVEVFAKAGEIRGALELLELLFSMPAGREVTVAFLKVWPGFDPLRGDPRFSQLLERFAVPSDDGA